MVRFEIVDTSFGFFTLTSEGCVELLLVPLDTYTKFTLCKLTFHYPTGDAHKLSVLTD